MTATQREALCCRCAKAPAARMIQPHGVGLCAACYLDNLRYGGPAPESAAA